MHARHVLLEVKRIQLHLKTGNGREHFGRPVMIGRIIL